MKFVPLVDSALYGLPLGITKLVVADGERTVWSMTVTAAVVMAAAAADERFDDDPPEEEETPLLVARFPLPRWCW